MLGKIIAFPFILGFTIAASIVFIIAEIVIAPVVLFYTLIMTLWKEESMSTNMKEALEFLAFPFTEMISSLWR